MAENIFRAQLIEPGDHVIAAMDDMTWVQITEHAEEVGPYVGLGKTNAANVRKGSDHAVDTLAEAGLYTMLDHKFHDIPRTVHDEVREATLSGGSLITVHASGGLDMLKAAVEGREDAKKEIKDPFLRASIDRLGGVLGITILTSLEDDECESIFGIPKEDEDGRKKKVVEFAHMALEAGLDGIVCSTLELPAVRANSNFDSLLVVTAGITPVYAQTEADQHRIGTPRQAINAGADLIVIGSGFTKAKKYNLTKRDAAQQVAEEVGETLAAKAA